MERTTAVVHARGDYVLFMDSADYASPDAVATFVAVAERTGADVLTCFLVLFGGVGDDETLIGHYPFLGAAVLSGVFHNHFGSRCIFVRKAGFSRLASRCDEAGGDCDWEFLARAALIGLRLEVIPRPLVSCRVPDNSGLPLEDDYQGHFHALRPYVEAMPPSLRGLPNAAFTMKVQYERQYGLANDRDELPLFGDEELAALLVKRLAAHSQGGMASLLRAWLDYSSARSNLPEGRIQRIPLIAQQLLKGGYHRFSHGFGSAFRDLRKPPPVWFRLKSSNLRATNRSPAIVAKKQKFD
jgi:glycosyltransferase involved in cell wall biosynthesis